MAIPISPGVYTKIIDLSTYVQAVPGTIGFVCILSDRGPDNAMTFVGGQDEFFKWFGRPDITTFGKQYGQGPYIANNHLSVSNSLYFSNISRINSLQSDKLTKNHPQHFCVNGNESKQFSFIYIE